MINLYYEISCATQCKLLNTQYLFRRHKLNKTLKSNYQMMLLKKFRNDLVTYYKITKQKLKSFIICVFHNINKYQSDSQVCYL